MSDLRSTSTYTAHQLNRDARAMVKGLGRFVGWQMEIIQVGESLSTVRLVAKFIRHYNPNRPIAQQAIERASMAL